MTQNSIIELDPPGQGLPAFEAFVARRVIFPARVRSMRTASAIKTVEDIGRKCLKIANALPKDKLTKQILIPRLTGIEDSSRNWSIIMAIEHLLIASQSMTGLIETLSIGQYFGQKVKIEDIKPTGKHPPETVLKAYENHLNNYGLQIKNVGNLRQSTATHEHPWFGELGPFQWLCLNAMHHEIHFRQIRKIHERL